MSDTYIVFGEAKNEDLTPSTQAPSSAEQADYQRQLAAAIAQHEAEMAAAPAASVEPVEGIEEKDIELVMAQAGVDRAKAIFALQGNDGDIVNAIMELTM